MPVPKGEVLKESRTDVPVTAADIKVEIPADLLKQERQDMPLLTAQERVRSFSEIGRGYAEEKAVAEAKRCMNCAGRLCLRACPYHAPQFGAEKGGKMQKCDFCLDRLEQNKKPICVDACIMRALDAGAMEELRAKYGDTQEAVGFAYSSTTMPSIIFRPKHLPKKTFEERKK